jgi:tetratricopeptide (TPR) repeat protein
MKMPGFVILILVLISLWGCSSTARRTPVLGDIDVLRSSENRRTYQADYDTVFRAAVDALRQVDNNTAKLVKHDQGLILFKKPNETGVINVYVKKIDEQTTSVEIEAKDKRKYWFDDSDAHARDAFFSELDKLLLVSTGGMEEGQPVLAQPDTAQPPPATTGDSDKKAELLSRLVERLRLTENQRFLEKLSFDELSVLEEKVRPFESLSATNEELGRRCAACYIDLARLYHDSGQYARAAEALKIAIAVEPDNAVAHCNLGDVYKHLRLFEDAIRELEQAQSLDPALPDTYINLGIIYDDYVVDDQKALQNYTKYLEVGGADEQVRIWIKALQEGS